MRLRLLSTTLLLALYAWTTGCWPNPPLPPPDPDWLIVPGERAGPITATTTEADLIAHYGAAAVQVDTLVLSEGFVEVGTRLLPGTPDEVAILWDEARIHPSVLRISGDSTRWRTAEGVTVGMTRQQLERINGMPFDLMGFGSNYAGRSTSWRDGALSGALSVWMERTVTVPKDEMVDLMEQVPFPSDHPLMRRLNLRVHTVEVHLFR